MAICKDKKTNRYYISYKLKLPNGEFKTRNIRNKLWTKKTYVRSIEQEEIEKDTRKVLGCSNVGNDHIKMSELIEEVNANNLKTLKPSYAYAVSHHYNRYILKQGYENTLTREFFEQNNFYNFLNRSYEINKNNGSSDKNYNKVLISIKMLIEYAFDREYISATSYSKDLRLAKPIKENDIPHEKLEYWTYEQFKLFLDTFNEKDQNFKLLFEVAYWGALRLGELIALNFEDFNYNNKTIMINKSLDQLGNLTTPKNTSSKALVDLPRSVCEEIQKVIDTYKPKPNEAMFFIERTSRTTIRRVFDNHTKMANLPHIKIHGLRHSMASLMINSGYNVLVVSKHLRHASTQQTLDTYAHLFPKITQDKIEELFTNVNTKSM